MVKGFISEKARADGAWRATVTFSGGEENVSSISLASYKKVSSCSGMVAQELATADAATYGSAMLDSFKIDISHQEMERIIVELELIYRTQPGVWLPIHVRLNYVSHVLCGFSPCSRAHRVRLCACLPCVVVSPTRARVSAVCTATRESGHASLLTSPYVVRTHFFASGNIAAANRPARHPRVSVVRAKHRSAHRVRAHAPRTHSHRRSHRAAAGICFLASCQLAGHLQHAR